MGGASSASLFFKGSSASSGDKPVPNQQAETGTVVLGQSGSEQWFHWESGRQPSQSTQSTQSPVNQLHVSGLSNHGGLAKAVKHKR